MFEPTAFQNNAFQVPGVSGGGGGGAKIWAANISKKKWKALLAERKKERDAIAEREAVELKQREDDDALAILLLMDD